MVISSNIPIDTNPNNIISIPKMQLMVSGLQCLIDMYNDTLHQDYVSNEYQWENKVNKMQEKGYSQKRIQWVKRHRINRINCKVFNSWKRDWNDTISMFLSQPLVQLVRDMPLKLIDFTDGSWVVI